MASQSNPYKPDNKEKNGYFYGLAGRPRLVARTSTERWTEPQHPVGWDERLVQTRKRYLPIKDDEIVSKWNNDLSSSIIKALNGCTWNYFFPIRIGLVSEYGLAQGQSSTVLLVAVEDDSLQWEEGIATALKCRKILHQFRVSDVEVEICESRYTRHAACEHFESNIDTERWFNENTNTAALDMLSYPGYPIGYLEDRKGQGTVGLHLRLSENQLSKAVYGLTCRHVVSADRAIHESYKFPEGHRQYHVQANHTGFEVCMERLEKIQSKLEGDMKPLLDNRTRWEEWYIFDETKKAMRPTEKHAKALDRLQSSAAYNARIIKNLEKLKHKDRRVIGHLAYHSSLEISSLRPGYLKDWALVELNPDKFVNGPENKVFIGRAAENADSMGIHHILENGFLDLSLGDEPEVPQTHFTVGKRGSKTGLTFGIKSGVEAVIRHPSVGSEDVYAWEMLIVPEEAYNVFSARGDSGAAIFDTTGRVVGLVTGSTDAKPEDDWRGTHEAGESTSRSWKGYPGGHICPEKADATSKDSLAKFPKEVDVTFATPIQWVLDDIQDFTGLQAVLA
ncbi:hypothetical protein F5Y07DRAFT_393159 [Xylaria sp. FL0933]|nr:hypothetical protein F5Y07DRAFT_393159 [Xylaria sp. FL0933]